jgi:hypothetical protein
VGRYVGFVGGAFDVLTGGPCVVFVGGIGVPKIVDMVVGNVGIGAAFGLSRGGIGVYEGVGSRSGRGSGMTVGVGFGMGSGMITGVCEGRVWVDSGVGVGMGVYRVLAVARTARKTRRKSLLIVGCCMMRRNDRVAGLGSVVKVPRGYSWRGGKMELRIEVDLNDIYSFLYGCGGEKERRQSYLKMRIVY